MTLWMVCKYPEQAMFKIWLKSVEFEVIKNTFKDGWHCWRFGGFLTFLTGADVLGHDLDVYLKVLRVSVSIFVKIWCLEAEICSFKYWLWVSYQVGEVGCIVGVGWVVRVLVKLRDKLWLINYQGHNWSLFRAKVGEPSFSWKNCKIYILPKNVHPLHRYHQMKGIFFSKAALKTKKWPSLA